jgi:RNA polymerase sigma-70 factor (ECF subfamily)
MDQIFQVGGGELSAPVFCLALAGARTGEWMAEPQNALVPGSRETEVPGLNADQERQWIRSIAGGDRSAFERLFHAYQRRLFGYIFRMVGKTDAAEELASDVMLEVWKGAGGFKGESKVSTWIFGIARFRAISHLRRSNPAVVDIEHAGPLADSHERQDEVLVKESTREEVRTALKKLSRQHQEVIELTFYQGFSYPEIAEILDCPVNTVKTRMFYARKELRQLLEEGRRP